MCLAYARRPRSLRQRLVRRIGEPTLYAFGPILKSGDVVPGAGSVNEMCVSLMSEAPVDMAKTCPADKDQREQRRSVVYECIHAL
jgi:hypothetical protein